MGKLRFSITDEAAEYARLYEKTFYEAVIRLCKEKIDIIEGLHELITKKANDD